MVEPDSRTRLGVVAAVAIAAVSGVVTAVAFAPIGWWPLAFVGVLGVLAVQWRARIRRGALTGFVYGLTFFFVLLAWMTVIGIDAWILLAAYCALWNAALGALVAPLSRLRGSVLWIPSAWVVMEALRGRVPLGGFPWGEIAFSQGNSPVGALTGIAGMAGVTFLIVALAVLTVEGIRRRRVLPVALLSAVVIIAIIVIPRPLTVGGEGSTATVAVVQGGTPGTGMDAMSEDRVVLLNHVDQTLRLAAAVDAGTEPQPDFVVWPENGSDIDPFRDPSAAALIDDAVQAIGAPVLVGAVLSTEDPTKVENAGIVWDPVSGPGERYVKMHPVPFGEFLPFRDQLTPLIGRFDRVPRDFVRGAEPGVLTLGGVVVGDAICFEVAYDDVFTSVIAEGAEVITVQTNNATYQSTGQPVQQWDIERLRALNTGRAVVVASTTGISGFIAPDGTVQRQLGEGETGYLVSEVRLSTSRTPASMLGVVPEIAAGAVLLIAVGLGVYVRRRRTALERSSVGS